MKTKLLFIIVVFFTNTLTTFAQSENTEELPSITIKINGLKNSKGKILAAIFNSENSFLKEEYKHTSTPIDDIREVTIIFENIPPGYYSVSLRHDENNNGKMDLGWMKIPKEPYAFSNNAKSSFGPPTFEETKFKVENKDVIQLIRLK